MTACTDGTVLANWIIAPLVAEAARERRLRKELGQFRLSSQSLQRSGRFSGDPPLPVARLTPATGHRVIFFVPTTTTILVCDEDASVRRMVARVLETAGYDAVLASGGPEALTALRDVRPDLLLLDINAPGPEGWEVLEQLHQSHPELPIILITGWPNLAAQAAQRGIKQLMEKPLDLPVLLDVIQQLVGESRRPARQRTVDASAGQALAAGLSLGVVAGRR